jgi:phosphinothricin acetyltransferase
MDMGENHQVLFREANPDDLSFVLDLYNYYILNTTAIFDYEKITIGELQARLSYANKRYRTFMVCDTTDKNIIGFCFLTQFRKKTAYDRTAEMGIYLAPENTGKKIGKSIIKFLEGYAKENQIEVIIATISGENIASVKLFEKMGYARCAHYRKIAIKFNRHLDLMNYEKILNE